MITRWRPVFVLAGMLAGPAVGLDLALPVGAREIGTRNSAADVFAAPVAPYDGVSVPAIRIEGDVQRRVYRLENTSQTPLQILAPVRDQLNSQGLSVVLDCPDTACGGFDFRFGIETLPAPTMFVNLRSFHALTAVRGPPNAPEQAISILVSTSGTVAYVQVISAGPSPLGVDTSTPARPQIPLPQSQPQTDIPVTSLVQAFTAKGSAVLAGVDFAPGAAALQDTQAPSMGELAQVMNAQPGLRILLVGHTDTDGQLAANIALSRARASAVRAELILSYGIAPNRIEAEGAGYLAPISSNATAEGRALNRRVEAVVLGPE